MYAEREGRTGGEINRRDEEWDQEPWVHEKHGGVRGGLGQGGEYAEREGRAWVVGVGQAGGHALGAGRAWDEEWDQEPWVHEKHGGVRGGLGQGKEYAEREGRMGGGRGAWVVGVGQAGGHALGGAMGP